MRFSQRIGKQKTKMTLDKEGLSDELLNCLWSLILDFTINSKNSEAVQYYEYTDKSNFYRSLWMYFFKLPVDDLKTAHFQIDSSLANKIIRDWFFKKEWYLILDFVEYCVNYDYDEYQAKFNRLFKREMSAYRFVDGKIIEINSQEEIVEIESAIHNSNKFSPVKSHLKRALELYADKKSPDYRNSIKESISAVESLSKIIVKNDKTTLGKALLEIEKKNIIPSG